MTGVGKNAVSNVPFYMGEELHNELLCFKYELIVLKNILVTQK